jgi:hypothetical protein
MSRSAAPTGRRLLPVPGESAAWASGAGLPGRGVPARHAPDQSRQDGAAAGTNRNVTIHEGGGNRMPQPRRHLDNAAKQRAYRVRQDLARPEGQQAKGLPYASTYGSAPAHGRERRRDAGRGRGEQGCMAGRETLRSGRFEGEQRGVQQELVGIGVFLAPIQATGDGQAAMQRADRLLQSGAGAECGEQMHSLQTHDLGGFDQ